MWQVKDSWRDPSRKKWRPTSSKVSMRFPTSTWMMRKKMEGIRAKASFIQIQSRLSKNLCSKLSLVSPNCKSRTTLLSLISLWRVCIRKLTSRLLPRLLGVTFAASTSERQSSMTSSLKWQETWTTSTIINRISFQPTNCHLVRHTYHWMLAEERAPFGINLEVFLLWEGLNSIFRWVLRALLIRVASQWYLLLEHLIIWIDHLWVLVQLRLLKTLRHHLKETWVDLKMRWMEQMWILRWSQIKSSSSAMSSERSKISMDHRTSCARELAQEAAAEED